MSQLCEPYQSQERDKCDEKCDEKHKSDRNVYETEETWTEMRINYETKVVSRGSRRVTVIITENKCKIMDFM